MKEQENDEKAVKDVEKLQTAATLLLLFALVAFFDILIHDLQPDKEYEACDESDCAEASLGFSLTQVSS